MISDRFSDPRIEEYYDEFYIPKWVVTNRLYKQFLYLADKYGTRRF